MKLKVKIVAICTLSFLLYGLTPNTAISIENAAKESFIETAKIIAKSDTFYFVSGCGNLDFSGNVMDNDIIPEGITAKIMHVISSGKQFITFGGNGNFAFHAQMGYNGIFIFSYKICDKNDESNFMETAVVIDIKSDNDCDGIYDYLDSDDDNDGIPDVVEGSGKIDTDFDKIPDSFDIDDDNDGIPDVREWQLEKDYILPSGIDANYNGWDDIFEKKINPYKFLAVDTDNDQMPDFLDNDSDDDELTDLIEANDSDFDNLADFNLFYSDQDMDGLDDAFDIVKCWYNECNSTGSNVPIPDHDNNGVSDFREKSSAIGNKDGDNFLEYYTSKITFPNPTSGIFSIQIQDYSSDIETHLKIFGLNGDLKSEIIPTSSVVNVNLTSFQSGIYVIKIITPYLTCSKKLILQSGNGY